MVPTKALYSLAEAAVHCGYTTADLAGWAAMGKLVIVTGIAPVECSGKSVGGLVAVPVADILPMFRKNGTGPTEMSVRRVREVGSNTWLAITEPVDGVVVAFDDLMICGECLLRFETERGIVPRAH